MRRCRAAARQSLSPHRSCRAGDADDRDPVIKRLGGESRILKGALDDSRATTKKRVDLLLVAAQDRDAFAGIEEPRRERAWRHGIDVDPSIGGLQRQGFGEPHDRGLRGGIGADVRQRRRRATPGKVDDFTVASAAHRG